MGKYIHFYTKCELTKPIFAVARNVTRADKCQNEEYLDQYMMCSKKNEKSKNIHKNRA
jgi:hypothetical protein